VQHYRYPRYTRQVDRQRAAPVDLPKAAPVTPAEPAGTNSGESMSK
jgi:hypothetical protein